MEIQQYISEIVASFTHIYGMSAEVHIQREHETRIVTYSAIVGPSGLVLSRRFYTSPLIESLASVDVALLNGIVYMIRFRVEHESAKECFTALAKVWQRGTVEPHEWTCRTSCVTVKEQLSLDEVMSQFEEMMSSFNTDNQA